MSLAEERIQSTQEAFEKKWLEDLAEGAKLTHIADSKRLATYKYLVMLSSWDHFFREHETTGIEFFTEARNDAALSHLFGSLGYWRPALKSLRSLMENSLHFLYYRDHPVELRLWQSGQHQLRTSELFDYFHHHPQVNKTAQEKAVAVLRAEYKILSKAVHASSESFRMTSADGSFPALRSGLPKHVGPWLARFKMTMRGLAILFVSLHFEELQGTARRPLRRACGYAIPPQLRPILREVYDVNIFG